MNRDEFDLPGKDQKAPTEPPRESPNLEDVENLIRECDDREKAADLASDGWSDAIEFLHSLTRS